MVYFVIDRALIAVNRRFSRRIRHIQLELHLQVELELNLPQNFYDDQKLTLTVSVESPVDYGTKYSKIAAKRMYPLRYPRTYLPRDVLPRQLRVPRFDTLQTQAGGTAL